MRIKLNAITSTVKGKRVVLVDDSIVRGTTSARTIRLLREAGAAEVHYRISAPPFAHPCYFGTDIPDEKDLIATGHTVEEINDCLLYTSDAADDLLCVDLGGYRTINKKTVHYLHSVSYTHQTLPTQRIV